MKMVSVTWSDARGCSPDWEEIDDKFDMKPCLNRSLGFLVVDKPDYIVVMPHVTCDNLVKPQQGCGSMAIPRSAIVEIRTLDVMS